ncbi:MAG: N-succinylarginine dihydrolase, partial [Caulobacteraceae bacterium]
HFSDEGAANHMRLSKSHADRGLNVFVVGEDKGGRFPARQTVRASQAVARLGGLTSETAVFTPQSDEAIQAGAFHNDVVAVANETLLLAHPQAFEDKAALYERLARVTGFTVFETEGVTLGDAVKTYLFNSQLITLPGGGMGVVLPAEARASEPVWREVERMRALGLIAEAVVVDVRESMRNGGGPACLRLRVPVSDEAVAAIDQRFLLDEAKWDALGRVVEANWPEALAPADLTNPGLWAQAREAMRALNETVDGFAA